MKTANGKNQIDISIDSRGHKTIDDYNYNFHHGSTKNQQNLINEYKEFTAQIRKRQKSTGVERQKYVLLYKRLG